MRTFLAFIFVLFLAGPALMAADLEGKFVKTDGTVIVGRTVNYRPEGVTFRYSEGPDAGRFSSRIPWREFTQESLKFFLTDLEARKFVELLIEVPPDQMDEEIVAALERPKPPPIIISGDSSPGRPYKGVGMLSAMLGGGGLLLSLILFAGNLYAAYEIAIFRRIPIPILCGAAAVLPFITPAVAVFLPTMKKRTKVVEEYYEEEYEDDDEDEEEGEYAEGEYAEGAEAVHYAEPVAPAPVQYPETQVYERGRFNLNRRFIETKFAGFFRVVPGENEKDMVLVVKCATGQYITNRILKATNTEFVIQIDKGSGATIDQTIQINDLFEIRLKHRDAPE